MNARFGLISGIAALLVAAQANAQDAELAPPSEAELAAEAAEHCTLGPGEPCNSDRLQAAHEEAIRLREERYAARNAANHAAKCARTFDARARSARRDYGAWLQETADAQAQKKAFEKAGGPKLMEFFEAHCRFLNGLETAIRQLDDPNTIVCNKPKPKGLTVEIVAYGTVEQGESLLHIAGDDDNRRCQASDTAERFSLVFDPDGQDAESLIASQSLLCYADERPSCKKAMPLVAQLKAKLASKQAQGAPPSPPAPGD